MKHYNLFISIFLLGAACGRINHIGKPPDFTPDVKSTERIAMVASGLASEKEVARDTDIASLWSGGQTSLLGDRRAIKRGDILTVVIEIEDSAEIKNSTARSRSSSESLAIPDLFGVPERINQGITDGASLDSAVSLDGSGSSSGDGSVRRSESLTLRVAATVIDVLPNGILSIEGSQEVRVNFELRELLVSGYVRPEDISRMNEITYDKIASARISYGGRGQITDVQQPRIGQQILDVILPF